MIAVMDLRRRPVLGSASVVMAAALLLGALLGWGEALSGPLIGELGQTRDDVDHARIAEAGFGVPAVVTGMSAFAACQLHAIRGAGRFRPADAVTLLRTLLQGIFAAAVVEATAVQGVPTGSGLPLVLILLAVIILIMDGLDGAVARSAGGGTPAGARYDEAADAVVLLVMAFAAALAVGWWALLLGLLRPAFALGGRVRPAWRRPLEPSRRRKVLGIAPGVLLLAALAPWPGAAGEVPAGVELGLRAVPVALGLALVTISFALDVRHLERTEAGQARKRDPRRPGRSDR